MNNVLKLLKSATVLEKNDFISQIAGVEGAFTPEECSRIIDMVEPLSSNRGTVEMQDPSGETTYTTTSARKSNVTFITPDSRNGWIFDKLDACLGHVNQAYKFELLGFYEGAQIASYEKEQFYDWHIDLGQGKISSRKLSISVQLSPGDEYDGGNLEFMCIEGNVPRSVGSVVVFPSYLTHRVSPVTRGIRWSMVSWIHGPPFC